MKLAIDFRMIGSGGIGTYFESILPYFLDNFQCLLFGDEKKITEYTSKFSDLSKWNFEIEDCTIQTFSVKELLAFPASLLKKINACDAYYSPYCNIPSGIKIPVYTTIHDVVFLDLKGLSSKVGTIIRKFFYQRAINKSKVIFTVSQFSAERIKKNLKVKNKEIIVTYNSVPSWFTPELNKIEKENYILFVGNIKKHKGLHTLISALKILIQENFQTKLLIVGNAENFRTGDDSIIKEINALPQNIIEFTGKVSDTQLREIYSKAKLLIQPSLYEGFGMPPLEALTMKTNVILSDIPVFKEIYKEFPVTFFTTNDSQDLAKKIIENLEKESPSSLPQIYSFDKTSNIIISNIKKQD